MRWLGDLGSAVLGFAYDQRLGLAVIAVVGLLVGVRVARRHGWLAAVRRHPIVTMAVLLPALAIALPVGWYLASPLVLTTSIDEPAPVAIAAEASPTARVPGATVEPSSTPTPTPARPSVGPHVTTAPPVTTPRPPIVRTGSFRGSDDFHFGRGTARLIETSPGTFVVRLEDFAVRNGPDLYVYLSPSPTGYADGAIELGRLKADTGNQNYAVPGGAIGDGAGAASVVIWCRQFSHLFATAPLDG